MTEKKKVIVIGGPTASGKSGLALSLAQKYNGCVINADSIQMYDGLPLLTAQPSPDDFKTAPHLLYGVMPPTDICTASRWRDDALDAIQHTLDEERLPIIVGGTGLYIRTLAQGISPIPDVPKHIRDDMIAQHAQRGAAGFHALLQKADPAMGEKLHLSDTQRVIRAMEVFTHTGKGLSYWQGLPPTPPPEHLVFKIVHLLPDKEKLYGQCHKRFHQMIDKGVLDEVKNFHAQYGDRATSLDKALGYKELWAYLKGDTDLDTAIARAQQATRHYAKRQVTWFKHQMQADVILETPDINAVKTLI